MDASSPAPAGLPASAPEVVVAGHVSWDVFLGLKGPLNLEPGGLAVVGPAVMSTGGAVANTGLALHRLGVPTRLRARVGADLFGGALIDELAAHDRSLAADLITSAGEPTSYTIVINPPGVDRSFLHCPGANETFGADDVAAELLAGARVFHFGYPPLMPRMYADGGAQLRRMFASVQQAGPATSLDLCEPDPDSEAGRVDWQAVLGRTLPFVDVFSPSIDELLFIFDRSAHDRLRAGAAVSAIVDHARLAELGETLIGMGAAVAAIKLGDQGLYLRTTRDSARIAQFCGRLALAADAWRGREVLSPCFEARTVAGTTGSGDSTVAGLLAALLRGADPREAATGATAVGACSVEALDSTSGIPAWPLIDARVRSGWPRRPVEIELAREVTVRRDATGTLELG